MMEFLVKIYFHLILNLEVVLQINPKSLHSINMKNLFSELDKSMTKNLGSAYESALKSILFFISIKHLHLFSQLNAISNNSSTNNEEIILCRLNAEFSKLLDMRDVYIHILLSPYKHKLFQLNISHSYDLISKEKEIYGNGKDISNSTNECCSDMIHKLCQLYSDSNISKLFYNEISFIHLNEFLIILTKTCNSLNNKFSLSAVQLNLLTAYFTWRNLANKSKETHLNCFTYSEVLLHCLKYAIINCLELIINLKEEENLNTVRDIIPKMRLLLKFLLDIVFTLEVESKEVYIFASLAILILYIQFLKPANTFSDELFVKYIKNCNSGSTKSTLFIQNILQKTKVIIAEDSLIENDMIILIKLIEFYLFEKYNKNLKEITQNVKKINVSDFVTQNLFFFENVYDNTQVIYANFKEKIYWNLGEIIQIVYQNFPKMIKKTILRHLQHIPQQDSLIFHIIKYYYSNKDYRKSKILIKKIIIKEDKTELLFDINTICLLMIGNILIYEEKYGEAMDLAIYNLERLKSNNQPKNEQMLIRAYFILGFCYSKLGDNVTNYEEKTKYSQLALSSFKCALEKNKENPIFTFYLARQYYELKLFSHAEDTLALLEGETSTVNMFNLPNNHYFYALKVLILIARLKFEPALNICDLVIKSYPISMLRFNVIVIIKFYLLIMKFLNTASTTGGSSKSVNPSANIEKEETALINKMSDYIKIIFDSIDEEIKNLETAMGKMTAIKSRKATGVNPSTSFVSNSNNMVKIEFDNKQMQLKELVKFADFEPFSKEVINDEDLKSSMKLYNFEKKNLENLRIEIMKNFYLLTDILVEHGFDKEGKLDEILATYSIKIFTLNLSDDVNLLTIVKNKY